MEKNQVKAKLQAGEPALGAFCNIPSPETVEILGLLGFDFAIIDAEHGTPGVQDVEHMVRAAEATNITPIVRIATKEPQDILRYLDTRASGAQIPMVNTGGEARAVVSAVKYPPVGRRGLAGVRANGWGIPLSLGEYTTRANKETLVVVQIETAEAVAVAREIIETAGVDVVFLGPTDLSASLGYPGQTTHPRVLEVIERVGREAIAAGKAAGTIARDPEAYAYWRQRGFLYLCTGVTYFLAQAAREYLEGSRRKETAFRAARP